MNSRPTICIIIIILIVLIFHIYQLNNNIFFSYTVPTNCTQQKSHLLRLNYTLPCTVSRRVCTAIIQTLTHVCMCVWPFLPVQSAGTVTLLWVRKGCLKVGEGLEHFKALLTSKRADAKSALCKWTAGTSKEIQARSPELFSGTLYAPMFLETGWT